MTNTAIVTCGILGVVVLLACYWLIKSSFDWIADDDENREQWR